MAEANTTAALALLKANLGYYDASLPDTVEANLSALLESAKQRLLRAGIILTDDSVDDAMLQAMYAAWLYRKGQDGTAKPPMLQTEIRNRQVDSALEGAEVDL